MDKYTVKLYARAYRDLDGIYEYIANNLSEPTIASNMIDTLEEAIYSRSIFPNAVQSDVSVPMQTAITVNCL